MDDTPKSEPTDGAPETILITPLGLNPKPCAYCGEWNGASKALRSSTRRHAKTADKFSQYRDISDARIAELEAALTVMVNHEVDYMLRNLLGDPEKQQRIIESRRALKSEGEGDANASG